MRQLLAAKASVLDCMDSCRDLNRELVGVVASIIVLERLIGNRGSVGRV